MLKRSDRNVLRLQRHTRLRKRMAGSPQRPRVSVFRSLKHMYAQIVDDSRGVTLAAASTMDPELRGQAKGEKESEAGARVGQLIAVRGPAKGITPVVVDSGGR